jgi:hypothetical protein
MKTNPNVLSTSEIKHADSFSLDMFTDKDVENLVLSKEVEDWSTRFVSKAKK